MERTKRTLPMVAILMLALVLTGTVASARPPAQEDVSEDLELYLNGPVAGPQVNAVIGDDADENGYTGVVRVADHQAEASETTVQQSATLTDAGTAPQADENGYAGPAFRAGEVSAEQSEAQPVDAPNWDQFFVEPQADQDGYGAPQGIGDHSPDAWSDFHYIYVAGAALRPRDSSSGWDYSGVGCVSRASGSELLNIHLPIPDGSRIDYLRIYYYDTSGSNSTAWVTNYDSGGNFTDVTTVASSGSGGYGTQLSAYSGHVANTASRSYVLNWSAGTNGSSMRLCGLRVAYRVPV
ncbi:MAG: hypothetical protein KDI12_00690 [Anaerolineae bacterium]|nr:hypothetical protein [Anaerolineae bacterium]